MGGTTKKKYTDAAVADEATVSIEDDNTYRHQCCKRCERKRQQTTTSRYFPQDIIFQCLLHLPADFLHGVVRHVCREWSLILHSSDFARYHLLRNSTNRGVLIQHRPPCRKGFYLEIGRGGGSLEIHEFHCGFDDLLWTSCNGLTVISSDKHWNRDFAVHYVANPLTKQLTVLPPYSNSPLDYMHCSLAFAEGSMVYKVVRECCRTFGGGPKKQIAVLTVGVDRAWRHIDITHLLLSEEKERQLWPLVTGGYVHWVVIKGPVLTLNVETEVIRRFPLPPVRRTFEGKFLAMGSSSLSYVSPNSSDRYYRDVWEMNSETGEWSMLFRIKKRPINNVFKDIFWKHEKSATPLCWLAPREVLIFGLLSRQNRVVAYNVNSGKIQQVFELDGHGFHFIPHVKSLAWWE